MKLVRYGAAGREKPGIVDNEGHIRDLSKMVKDIDGAMLAGGGLAKIKKAKIDRLPMVNGKPRLGPCIGNVRQLHRDRAELRRPCCRGRRTDSERADHLQQGADVDLRPERQHDHPERVDQARL